MFHKKKLLIAYSIVFTMHIGFYNSYNEVHPHVRFQKNQVISGAFLNSEGNISPYIGLRYDTKKTFIEGGLVHGYSYKETLPYARLGYKLGGNINLLLTPGVEKRNNNINPGVVIVLELLF